MVKELQTSRGIFDTIKGFVNKYPNRIIETPLAEDSVAGICIGAALNGAYPINTHIRADFGLLIFNQLINLKVIHISFFLKQLIPIIGFFSKKEWNTIFFVMLYRYF